MTNPSRSLPPFEPPRYQFYTPSSFSPTSYTPPPLPNTFQPHYNPPTLPLVGRVTAPTNPGQTFSFQSPTFAPTYNPPNLPPSFLTAPIAPPVTSLRTQPQSFPMPAVPNVPNPSFQVNFPPAPSLPKNLATSYQPISPGIQPPSVISLPDPSLCFAGGSLPTLSGRAHFLPALQPPISSGTWAPTLERPFSDKAIVPVPAFSSPLPAFNFTFQSNNTHQSYLRQIEQNLKMYYLADAPPERPFPSMPFMAFQINHKMTVFADPAVMHDLFHHTTSAQRYALQAQFSEIMDRVSHSRQFSESIAVIAVPTAQLPTAASPGKMRKFFSNLGGALKSDLSNTTHQVWAFVGPMNEEVVRTKDYIATKMGLPPDQQSSEITRNGHQRIDAFFKTSLAYRHDPNYHPPIPITIVGLPPPMLGGGALVGRVSSLRAGSVGANAVRTGSIASEAIKDVSAVKRSGAVGQELIAVKTVRQVSGEVGVGCTAQKVITETRPVAPVVNRAQASLPELKAGDRIATLNSKTISGAKKANAGVFPSLEKPKSISWAEPKTLHERLALEEAKMVKGDLCDIKKIKDPRYPPETWEKMQYQRIISDGTKINIHYWRNKHTNERIGFKFKSGDN